jgi:hypothetical protein
MVIFRCRLCTGGKSFRLFDITLAAGVRVKQEGVADEPELIMLRS